MSDNNRINNDNHIMVHKFLGRGRASAPGIELGLFCAHYRICAQVSRRVKLYFEAHFTK